MDYYVENVVNNSQNAIERIELVYIHKFIIAINTTFPPFFAEKRYKLINFAPEIEIVDKLS